MTVVPSGVAMDYEDIRVTQDAGVLTLTLHRPDKLNVFTPRMGEEIMQALRDRQIEYSKNAPTKALYSRLLQAVADAEA